MKATTKTTEKITITSFLLMIMLIAPVSLTAQYEENTLSANAYQGEMLYAEHLQGVSETGLKVHYNNTFKSVKLEKELAEPLKYAGVTKKKLSEALEVVFEQDMHVEEWMKTNFSYTAQAIACQPISDESSLEVEDWMVSDAAWTLE